MARRLLNERHVHESTARGLCRAMFLLLAVMPTLACCGWALAERLPMTQRWRAAAWEKSLSNAFGVDVALAAVEPRAPGRVALYGLRLKHPETHKTVFSASRAEVDHYGRQWLIKLEQAEVDARQLAFAARKVHDWLLCRPGQLAELTVIDAQHMAVRGLESITGLDTVSLRLFPKADSQLLSLTCHPYVDSARQSRDIARGESDRQPSALSERHPVELIVERHRLEGSPQTALRFKTGSNCLPCEFLGCLLPMFDQMGPAAHITGDFVGRIREEHWSLETVAACTLQQVDFARWTQGTEFMLAGQGNIAVHQLAMTDQGLIRAIAAVDISNPGHISSQLLAAAARHLEIDTLPLVVAPGYLTQFSQLQVLLQIQPQRLHLAGGGHDGSLLIDAQGRVLAARAGEKFAQSLDLSRLIHLFSELTPDSGAHSLGALAPSRFARQALRWLPLEQTERLDTAHRQLVERDALR